MFAQTGESESGVTHQTNCLLELAVVENDERRLAAEFERADLRVAARAAARQSHSNSALRVSFPQSERKRGQNGESTEQSRVASECEWDRWHGVPLHELLADFRGAGEADFPDERVPRQCVAHLRACTYGNIRAQQLDEF